MKVIWERGRLALGCVAKPHVSRRYEGETPSLPSDNIKFRRNDGLFRKNSYLCAGFPTNHN